jgi:ribosomal subunit interface protein
MQIQTKVISHTLDTKLVSSIEKRVSKLKHFFHHINDVRITLTVNMIELHKGRAAEIKLHVPNGFIFIKESSKTFDVALSKALVSLKLQLLRHRATKFTYCLIP